MFKLNDWVEIKQTGRIGKIVNAQKNDYCIILMNNKYCYVLNDDLKKCTFFHKSYSLGMFNLSIFKLKNKFSIRFEISKGWE